MWFGCSRGGKAIEKEERTGGRVKGRGERKGRRGKRHGEGEKGRERRDEIWTGWKGGN